MSYSTDQRAAIQSILALRESLLLPAEKKYLTAAFQRYFAQGAQHRAAQKLTSAERLLSQSNTELHQIQPSAGFVASVVTAAEEYERSAQNNAVDALTCAQNLTAASVAVIRLSSEMSSILAIVKANDVGSKIARLAEEINERMKALSEKFASSEPQAVRLAAEAADNNAARMKQLAGECRAAVDQFIKQNEKHNHNIADLVKANQESELLAQAAVNETTGSYSINKMNYESELQSYRTANAAVNLNLRVRPEAQAYTVQFNLSAVASREIKEGYIFLAPKDRAADFNLAQAEQLLQKKKSAYKVKLNPSKDHSYAVKIPLGILNDADGKKLSFDKPYVIFVLVKYAANNDLQKTNDQFLSLPSAPFQITNILESPAPNTFAVDKGTLSFQLSNALSAVSYRCIFLPANVDFLFDLQMAQQVPWGSYTLATAIKLRRKKSNAFRVSLDATTTDNFGNRIQPGQKYIPTLLAVIRYRGNDQYTFALSDWTDTQAMVLQAEEVAAH